MFTKEYIELCKNKLIQGLRAKLLRYDFYFVSEGIIDISLSEKFHKASYFIWLPTGDQLDEEIVKICKENWVYKIIYRNYNILPKRYYIEIIDYSLHDKDEGYYVVYSFSNSNPLIAKIKLLIKLLEEK